MTAEPLLIYLSAVLGVIHTAALCGLILFFCIGMLLIGVGNFYAGGMSFGRRRNLLRKGWACLQIVCVLMVVLLLVPEEGVVREMAGLQPINGTGGWE